MRLTKIRNLFITLLLLNSCAKVSQDEMATLMPQIDLEPIAHGATAHSFFEEGGWPTEEWWEMFSDPQLNQIVQRALENSPTLQKAFAKVDEVEQEAKKERSHLFPKLGLNYDENWDYFSKNGFIRSFFPTAPGFPIPPTVNAIDLSLNFSYEFDFFGKNRKQFQSALGSARAERAEAQMAKLVLTTHVVQTYIELQMKIAQVQLIKQRLEKRRALYTLATLRSEKGLDPQIPVLEREQSIYQIEQSLIKMEKEVILDRHMLNLLAGCGPGERLISEEMTALFSTPFPLPTELSTNLLARRPDLTAQIWRVEAAAKAIGAAKADFYPRVNLLAFAGFEGLAFNQLFQFSSKQGGLEPALYLPIFTGGKLTATLKGKVAAFNEATHRYNELLLHAAKEVADGIATLQASHEITQTQSKSVDSAASQLALQNSRYKNAVNNFIAVIEKEERLLQERYLLVGFERDYLLSTVKLIKALGGGYTAPLPSPRGGG